MWGNLIEHYGLHLLVYNKNTGRGASQESHFVLVCIQTCHFNTGKYQKYL